MKVYRVTYYGAVQHPSMMVEHVPEDAELVRKVRDYDPDDPRYRRLAFDELKVGRKVPVFSVLVPIVGIMGKDEARAEAESMLIAWLKEKR